MNEFFGVLILISGFIIGLGAVTVIDIHGFLGRKSSYWTESTIRAHKVTKPLIWIGILLVIVGGFIFYNQIGFSFITLIHIFAAFGLILNGLFLSFVISPSLLEREREGRIAEILPEAWQKKIKISLIISDILWWGSLILFVYLLTL